MLDFNKILIDGGVFTLLFMALIVVVVLYNRRLILNPGDLPADILAAVPPKTKEEQRQAIWLGIPLMLVIIGLPVYSTYTFAQANPGVSYWALFGHIFLVTLMPNLADLLILDWLVFCTITPSFFVYPGTEGFAGYKDYGFHLRQHVKAFPAVVAGVAVLAGLVMWVA